MLHVDTVFTRHFRIRSFPLNSGFPSSISAMIQPADQISTTTKSKSAESVLWNKWLWVFLHSFSHEIEVRRVYQFVYNASSLGWPRVLCTSVWRRNRSFQHQLALPGQNQGSESRHVKRNMSRCLERSHWSHSFCEVRIPLVHSPG